MFKKLIATAVSLVLCLATLCACRSYDEFYFDELVFLDVWIGHSGEPGKDHFVGEQLISSVEEYVDFCIRWDINLAGGYEDERMENLKEIRWKQRFENFDKSYKLLKKYSNQEITTELERAG